MAAAVTAKVIATSLILAISLQLCCGSAIPIWEFLTRNEKMSYLYSTFAQLVSVHCKATATTSTLPVNQCKRNLLAYGYEKLQTFSDAELDTYDPYQRGASELIWNSIMRGHSSATLITTRKPVPTPPDSSIIILTHQQAINRPQQQQHTSASTTSSETQLADKINSEHRHYGKNPMFDINGEHKHQYAMDMDIAYGYPSIAANPQFETFGFKARPQPPFQQVPSTSGNTATTQQHQTYLTGPLVFRVRPDGTPVEEDKHNPLPRDDDLEEFRSVGGRNSNNGEGSNSGTTTTTSASNSNNGNGGQQNKHRKIATISALKQQHLATLALQQQLQPPLQQSPTQQHQQLRLRRQYPAPSISQPLQLSTLSAYRSGRKSQY